MAKMQLQVGIKGDPNSFKNVKSDVKPQPQSPAPSQEKLIEPGHLINRMNHPVTLSYGGEALVIPARGRVYIMNSQKLGGLAMGIVFVKSSKKELSNVIGGL